MIKWIKSFNKGTAMSQVILEAQTNSNNAIPEFAVFDKEELNTLISRYTKAADWDGDKSLLSLKVSTLPEYRFSDESGNDVEFCQDLAKWEQVVTDVNHKGLVAIFAHTEDGSELFFEYSAKEE